MLQSQAARLENIFQLQPLPELKSWHLFPAELIPAKILQVSRLEQDIIDHRAGLKGTIVKDSRVVSGSGLIWADEKMAKRQQPRTAGAQSSTMLSLTGPCIPLHVQICLYTFYMFIHYIYSAKMKIDIIRIHPSIHTYIHPCMHAWLSRPEFHRAQSLLSMLALVDTKQAGPAPGRAGDPGKQSAPPAASKGLGLGFQVQGCGFRV